MTISRKATREQTKNHNQQLILRTIYEQGEISRVDIARHTRLTPTTVSSNVAELMGEGLVSEIGLGPSVGGKPPTLLSVVADARHILSLDLAHSQLRGALINLRGEIQQQRAVPLAGKSGEAVLELVFDLVDHLIAQATSPLLGIGIGTPGLIDTPRGVVRQAVNLDWYDLPLGERLIERYNLPVYVANDSHVAAIAEYTFGAQRGTSNIVVLKVGRGIGTGIVLNGRLLYGDGGGAGEIGHVVVAEHGPPCRCGNFGCLETVASSNAIIAQAQSLALHQPQSLLHAQVSSGTPLTLDAVVQAVTAGDTLLQPIIANAGRYLGIAVAHLVGALNINQIAVAGTVAQFGDLLLEPMRATVRQRALPALVAHTHISASTLGSDIVMLGAATLLMSHELGLS